MRGMQDLKIAFTLAAGRKGYNLPDISSPQRHYGKCGQDTGGLPAVQQSVTLSSNRVRAVMRGQTLHQMHQ
jgi:hypothetical protein